MILDFMCGRRGCALAPLWLTRQVDPDGTVTERTPDNSAFTTLHKVSLYSAKPVPRGLAEGVRARLVWFVVDPFEQDRVVVATLVQDPGGIVRCVPEPEPSVERLGSMAMVCLWRRTLRTLRRATSIDTLPMGLGPHVVQTGPIT